MDNLVTYREMAEADIERVISIYMDYYNNHEDGECYDLVEIVMHDRFYDRLMYKNCTNLVIKSKWIAQEQS